MKKLSNGADSSSRKPKSNLRVSGVAWFLFVVIIVLTFGGTIPMDENGIPQTIQVTHLVMMILLTLYSLMAVKVASQSEKAVVLRCGKFHSLRSPGMFWIVPNVDSVANWIDHRVIGTPF
jgi:membrane protease YdiL (CAAX protease family)